MGKFFHSKRRQHVSQSVMDVRAQLPVCLPIQHAEQNALQTGLGDVQICTVHQDNTVRPSIAEQRRPDLDPDRHSLIVELSLLSPALFARLMAYSQTSAASLWASCLRQATAARRSSR